jgi:hypothetical protein
MISHGRKDNMKQMMRMFVAAFSAAVAADAGDLTVEGDLNVTSNLAARTLSATNAALGALRVDGPAVFTGTLQGDGSAVTNLSGANLVGGSVGAGSLAPGAVTSAKIQAGSITDAHVAADAAISQSKVAGLADAVVSLNAHLAATDNPHGVTAAQIGALTNETDAAALAALAQYAMTNRIVHWQDAVDSSIWWEIRGGTNLTAYKVFPVKECILRVTETLVGGGSSTLFVAPGDYTVSGGVRWPDYLGSGVTDTSSGCWLYFYSDYVSLWDEFRSDTINNGLSEIPIYPMEWNDASGAALVIFRDHPSATVTNCIASHNLVTEETLASVAALAQYAATNKITRWQDSENPDIWWEVKGGTNLTAYVGTRLNGWYSKLEGASPELGFTNGCVASDMPYPLAGGFYIGLSYFSGGITPDVPLSAGDSCKEFFRIPVTDIYATGYRISNEYGTFTASYNPIITNVLASYNLASITGDVWQAIASAYPSSNPSNYVSVSEVNGLVAAATANLLTATGDGSQLTGITATQVGAYTVNQTDAAIASALAGFNPESGVQTNHVGDIEVDGFVTATALIGDGAGVTNLNLSAYAGDNLSWTDGKLHTAAGGAGYTDAQAVAAVTATNLNMNAHRVTGLAAPVADGDAVSKAYLRAVLSALPPQGDLSMGSYTNGRPAAFLLEFD